MKYRDLIDARYLSKPHSELVEDASRLQAKWILLDGEVDIDVLSEWIKKGMFPTPMEDVPREEIVDYLADLYNDVKELFGSSDDEYNLTITAFLQGNWD